VQHIAERKKLIDKLYRRASQAANHFKASIILYVLQEQTARAISSHAQCACLLSLQMGSIN
jgi:hypothetical protein